jgi:hypothetical protein
LSIRLNTPQGCGLYQRVDRPPLEASAAPSAKMENVAENLDPLAWVRACTWSVIVKVGNALTAPASHRPQKRMVTNW